MYKYLSFICMKYSQVHVGVEIINVLLGNTYRVVNNFDMNNSPSTQQRCKNDKICCNIIYRKMHVEEHK